MRQLERACCQPEAAGRGSQIQTQGTDQRGAGCHFHQERLPLQDYGVDMPNVPSDTTKGELFSGSLGLLNGNASPYNATDVEANQEMAEILRRKKKRKRGMRL